MKRGEITLNDAQVKAVKELKRGKILGGGVGSGKTFTSIFWAAQFEKPILVLTIAGVRDSGSWQDSFKKVGIDDYIVDSWNNIEKYKLTTDAVILFDEQRVSGKGKWAKTFIKMAHPKMKNEWILLSATPGDNWQAYEAVFVANGFYRNVTEYRKSHYIYDPYTPFQRVTGYRGRMKLEALRKHLLVDIPVERHTKRHRKTIVTKYDKDLYKKVNKERWDYIADMPIENPSRYASLLRRVCNSDPTRGDKTFWYMMGVDKLIIFYNFDYELERLLELAKDTGKPYAQWNGHKHEPLPKTDQWIFLAHYNSLGAGWNCIETDTILFYSLNYSYNQMEQAEGRIDRLNTPFTDLKYIYMTTDSHIDKVIMKTIQDKKEFNMDAWSKREFKR